MVAYVYAAARKSERAEAHLCSFAGILQVDGYGGDAALAKRRQQVRLALCWAHVWRKFCELAHTSPIATEVLCRIALLSTPSRTRFAETQPNSAISSVAYAVRRQRSLSAGVFVRCRR